MQQKSGSIHINFMNDSDSTHLEKHLDFEFQNQCRRQQTLVVSLSTSRFILKHYRFNLYKKASQNYCIRISNSKTNVEISKTVIVSASTSGLFWNVGDSTHLEIYHNITKFGRINSIYFRNE